MKHQCDSIFPIQYNFFLIDFLFQCHFTLYKLGRNEVNSVEMCDISTAENNMVKWSMQKFT